MCFSLKFCEFSELCQVLLQRWCSTCLVCVHTLTLRGSRERLESGKYFKIFEKTQYLMNTLYSFFFRFPLFERSNILEAIARKNNKKNIASLMAWKEIIDLAKMSVDFYSPPQNLRFRLICRRPKTWIFQGNKWIFILDYLQLLDEMKAEDR